MTRIVVLTLVTLLLPASESHASCERQASEPLTLVVTKCTTVDTATKALAPYAKDYAGVMLEGTVGTGKPRTTKVWVPASEKLTCAEAKPTATVTGTVDVACCDGDPNAPCLLQTSSILTKAKVAPKLIKQATRAELEAEVEQLRAENQKLRAELEAVLAREKERARRLELELNALQKKLK